MSRKTLEAKYVKAIAETAKTAGNAENKKSAFAEVVVDVVEPQRLTFDLFSAWMPTIQLQPGETFTRRVRRGRYPVRTMVPGSKHLTDVLSSVEQTTYMFDRLIAGTSHSLWEIQSGEVGSVEQMRADLRADIFDSLVSRVFNLLTTAYNGIDTPTNFTNVGGPLSQTALDAMIEAMLDNGQNIRAIVGTRKALRPMYGFAQFREFELSGTAVDAVAFPVESAFNEFTDSRKVTRYTGIPVIELPQTYRAGFAANQLSGNPLRQERVGLPDDRVLIISEDIGSVALMGGTEYQDYTDPTTQPPNYVLHAWQAYGMILDNLEGLGVLAITPA